MDAVTFGERLPISAHRRTAIAAAVGAAFWFAATMHLRARGAYALGYDYTLHWWAGDALRRGYSPYAAINAFSDLYPFCSGYLYWLPTAILLEPLARLPLQTAMPIFAGLSMAVLAYAFTRDGYWRLPLLASAPAVYCGLGGEVVPFVVAAILVPSLGWLAPMKYTIAAAGFAYNRSRLYVILAAGVVLLSIAFSPWWPRQWAAELHDVRGRYYDVPVMTFGGIVILAAVLRWRRPEARLLVMMSILPQTMLFYDQLPLGLLASTYREALAMAVLSYVAPVIAIATHTANADRETTLRAAAIVIVLFYYLPCLLMILRRPNVAR